GQLRAPRASRAPVAVQPRRTIRVPRRPARMGWRLAPDAAPPNPLLPRGGGRGGGQRRGAATLRAGERHLGRGHHRQGAPEPQRGHRRCGAGGGATPRL
ncbi:MAG: hypothetical protein AVDCRST_MAG88-124, partial [uncultured Thermomicrobiales bacterium]